MLLLRRGWTFLLVSLSEFEAVWMLRRVQLNVGYCDCMR